MWPLVSDQRGRNNFHHQAHTIVLQDGCISCVSFGAMQLFKSMPTLAIKNFFLVPILKADHGHLSKEQSHWKHESDVTWRLHSNLPQHSVMFITTYVWIESNSSQVTQWESIRLTFLLIKELLPVWSWNSATWRRMILFWNNINVKLQYKTLAFCLGSAITSLNPNTCYSTVVTYVLCARIVLSTAWQSAVSAVQLILIQVLKAFRWWKHFLHCWKAMLNESSASTLH